MNGKLRHRSPATQADRALWKQWGANVREARIAAGILQADLAEHVGVLQQDISRIERGARPHDSLRPRIAAALGTTVEALFPYTNEGAAA